MLRYRDIMLCMMPACYVWLRLGTMNGLLKGMSEKDIGSKCHELLEVFGVAWLHIMAMTW